MLVFNWSVVGLKAKQEDGGLQDVVKWVDYVVHAADGVVSASTSGTVRLSSPSSGDFVSLDQLTPELAVIWAQEALGEDSVALILSTLEDAISAVAAAGVAVPLPWEQTE